MNENTESQNLTNHEGAKHISCWQKAYVWKSILFLRGLFAALILVSIAFFVITTIASWGYPRGEFYRTGEYIEIHDGRQVVPEVAEDLSGLSLPGWVTWVRQEGDFLDILGIIALLVGGVGLYETKESRRWERYEERLHKWAEKQLSDWKWEFQQLQGRKPTDKETDEWIIEDGPVYLRDRVQISREWLKYNDKGMYER